MASPNGTTQPDRTHFQTSDNISHIWTGLGLPKSALASLNLEDDGTDYATSYKIADLAQSSIALSALSASLVDSLRHPSGGVKQVRVPRRHACLEFQTERLFSIDGDPSPSAWGPIGGLHATSDGHVRIHDVFPHHRNGALRLLGLDEKASRADVAGKVKGWKKVELEEAACENKLVIYALRSYAEWDALPHSSQVSDFPILFRKISEHGPKGLSPRMKPGADRCLRGLRVLELSRVIAAPTAGKTLAAHGADVLWVTSPNLPDLPHLDRNLSCGKRTIQLDLQDGKDVEKMRELVKECDILIQGYRPQSLAAKGFSAAELAALRPGLIYANLSAFGPTGPWSGRRGFDSLVQTCTGMNVSEAEHFGEGEAARVMPAQALDYGGGFLLATGICAALYRQATEGGSWEVHVSLAAVSKYLRSLGQRPGKTGFAHVDPADDAPDAYYEERESGFGRCRGLKHAADVEGATPGWDIMPKPLGSDEPRWM